MISKSLRPTGSTWERKVQTDCAFNTFDLILMQGVAANSMNAYVTTAVPGRTFLLRQRERFVIVITIFITIKSESKNSINELIC